MNTTNCTDRSLNPRDLCNIIKACKNSGVSKLSFEGLSLEFFNSDSQSNVELTNQTQAGQPNNQELYTQTGSVVTTQSQVLEPDEERALLLIEHPEDFENLMIQEDLERSRKHSTEVNEENEQNDYGTRTNLQ